MSDVQIPLFTSDATSSEGSEAGSTLCNLQDGRKIGQSGLEVAPANRSRQQANRKGKKTKDISGLKCSGSFGSAALTQFLVNKLKRRLDSVGSMEYSQTWKQKVTPAGRLYWGHTASARRTSDRDFTGWPTCRVNDGTLSETSKMPPSGVMGRLELAVLTVGWPSPTALSFSESRQPGNNRYMNVVTDLAGCELFSPASATKTETAPSVESTTPNADTLGQLRTKSTNTVNETGLCLLGGWASPSSRDWKDTPGMATEATNPDGSHRKRVDQLPRQAQLTSGPTSESSTAQTAKRGVLDAAFSRWLMGFPEKWDEASPNWASLSKVQEAIASDDSRDTEMQ